MIKLSLIILCGDNPDGISLQPPPPTFCRLRRFLRSKQKVGGGFGLFPVRSPLLREFCSAKFPKYRNIDISKYRYFEKNCGAFFSFPPATEMFHFAGFASPTNTCGRCLDITPGGFPHSEIPGSTVARHLPRAYRSHATSFIASRPRGIHHLPINNPGSHLRFPYLIFKGLFVSLIFLIQARISFYLKTASERRSFGVQISLHSLPTASLRIFV